MVTLRQKLRQVEQAALRLTGDRRQAAGLRKKIERHLHQLAAGHARATGRRVPAADEAQLLKSLVQFRRAGWVYDPALKKDVLVERGTGCVLADSKGALILRPRKKLLSKPAIKESVFLRHLKDPDVENFVPHMYRDTNGNVTVGIGELLRTPDEAKRLTFTKRGTNIAETFAAAADSDDPAEQLNDESLGAVQAVNFITAAREAQARIRVKARPETAEVTSALPAEPEPRTEPTPDLTPVKPTPPSPGCTLAFMDSGLRIVGLDPDREGLPSLYVLHGSAGLMCRGNWGHVLEQAKKLAGNDLGAFVTQQPRSADEPRSFASTP